MDRLAGTAPARAAAEPPLAELVYELLDAHADTVRLAAAPADDPAWDLHLRYLRDLQRTARELLAQSTDAPASALARAARPTRGGS